MNRKEAACVLEKAIKHSERIGSDEWLQSGFPIRLDVFRTAITALLGEEQREFVEREKLKMDAFIWERERLRERER